MTPRYEFGFGLTYSDFAYSDFNINAPSAASVAKCDLFETVATVTARIANTGSFSSAEISQLYLQIPGADTRALRGFAKTQLQPGTNKRVTYSLRKKDISSWDVVSQQWVQPTGTYEVMVGASVLDIRLQGSFTL